MGMAFTATASGVIISFAERKRVTIKAASTPSTTPPARDETMMKPVLREAWKMSSQFA